MIDTHFDIRLDAPRITGSDPRDPCDKGRVLSAHAISVAAGERDEARAIIASGGVALYCAGKGAPRVECRSVAEFEMAQRGRRQS